MYTFYYSVYFYSTKEKLLEKKILKSAIANDKIAIKHLDERLEWEGLGTREHVERDLAAAEAIDATPDALEANGDGALVQELRELAGERLHLFGQLDIAQVHRRAEVAAVFGERAEVVRDARSAQLDEDRVRHLAPLNGQLLVLSGLPLEVGLDGPAESDRGTEHVLREPDEHQTLLVGYLLVGHEVGDRLLLLGEEIAAHPALVHLRDHPVVVVVLRELASERVVWLRQLHLRDALERQTASDLEALREWGRVFVGGRVRLTLSPAAALSCARLVAAELTRVGRRGDTRCCLVLARAAPLATGKSGL